MLLMISILFEVIKPKTNIYVCKYPSTYYRVIKYIRNYATIICFYFKNSYIIFELH